MGILIITLFLYQKFGIACELNLIEGSMTVKTTRKTRDPYIVVKARDLIKLLARSIPVQQALKILNDDVQTDIIKIGGIVRNKERFVKRRQRLLGPDGATLKALELLTECYILVQGKNCVNAQFVPSYRWIFTYPHTSSLTMTGNTVAAMGPYKGLKAVRNVVVDCMKNVHPIYHIKTMMIKKELAKDPALANEDWSRFLPNFTKKNTSKRRKPHVVNEKKSYTPFPPAPVPSKVDLQLESGEYFINEAARTAKKKSEKRALAKERASENRLAREAEYVPPEEGDDDGERHTGKSSRRGEQHDEEGSGGEVKKKDKKRKSSADDDEVREEKSSKKRKSSRKD